MRKLFFTLLFGCLAFLGQAQTVVFSEDFETQPPPGINSGTTTCFAPNSRIQAGGLLSDSAASTTPGSTCILESNSFSTLGNFFVTLSFSHIAKIEFFDAATVELSTDGGVSWTQLIDDNGGINDNCFYLGTGLFSTQGSKFGEASYVNWLPGQSVLPDNSFWKTETFDISILAGDFPDVRVRFVLQDLNNNGLGFTGKGWFIDDVEVVASVCELITPNVQGLTAYSNTVYYLGPYTVNGTGTDDSGILSMTLNWTINGNVQTPIPMTFVSDSTYTCQIPAVADGDTVCYQIMGMDGSICQNVSYWPDPNDPLAYQCFVAAAGITYPYCDNFEGVNVGWTTSNLSPNSTTGWQLGTPSFAPTNSAHSPVTAWDIDLTTGYQNNANCVLQTPGFSGLIAGTTLSFWQNRQAEAFWDGVRIEWATDTVNGPWSLLGSVGCVDCVNWYTNGSINSSGQPAWDGSSNGWIQSSIILDATFNSLPQVWFRFVFTSDGSVTQAGFSIDDFCIALPQPDDVGVSAIILPGSTGPAGNALAPQVTVKNFGINPQTSFNVEYYWNDGSGPVIGGSTTFTPPVPLAPGATANVTLPSFVVPAGAYTLCAYTQLPGDGNNFNDTSCVSSLGIPVYTLTSCDDFESGNLGWQDSTTNAAAAQWQLGTPAFGATTGAYSGTNAWDINLTTGYGFGTNAYLTTPIYDLSTAVNPYLSFYRNQNTGTSDGLRVYYNANGSGNWVLLGTVNDPDGTNWYNTASINFAAAGFGGNTGGWVNSRYYLQNIINLTGATFIQFRFEFTCGFNNVPNDGVSIDDFCVVQPGPCDVGVTTIVEPSLNGPAGSTSNASVSVRNFGTQPQTNIPVEMSINGGAIVLTGTLAGPLAPGVEQTLALGTFTIPSGQYCIQSYTQLGCDGDASNDTANTCKVGIPTIPLSYTQPYCDDFEGTNVGWSTDFLANANPQSIWELGTPAFGVTNAAYSGVSAWDVNLTTGYGPNAGCILVSPFFDIAGAVDPQINWWHQWRSENNWDGVRMEYQLNNSGAWTLLGGFGGAFTPPNWIGWYNLGSIISSTQPAWTNTGGGWVNSFANDLSFMNGSSTVQFRYIFTSDGSVQQDGHTIDDFCMNIPVPLTAAPVNVLTNTINSSFIFPGQTVQFSSLITNPGTTPLDSVNVTLTINGVPYVIDTTLVYAPQLAAGGALLHAFTQTWQAAPGVYDICVITSNPNGSPDLNPFDDTTCITISVFDSVTVTSTNPYCTDFESGPQWVAVNALTYNNTAGNDWELGTPNQTIMNGAHSGVNAWAIDIDDNYQNRDSSGLFSPVFAIDQTKCYKLSFWHKYDSEPFADGGIVEYSVDNAQTWNHLGFASSQPQPWFNTPFITALGGNPGLPGWSGTETNWVQAEHDVNFWSTGTVIFRWRFASDNTVNNYEGWVIDDVCFEEIPGPCSVGLNDPVAEQLMLDQNYPNPFNGSTVVSYHLPSAGQVTVTVTDLLGQQVAMPVNSYMSSGSHTFEISAKSLASGIYYYTLEFEGQKITRKMVITE